jgi:hypothetical protein
MLLQSYRQGLQLCFRPHRNQRFTHNNLGPQSCESPNFKNFGTPQDKMSFGCEPRGEAQNIL